MNISSTDINICT